MKEEKFVKVETIFDKKDNVLKATTEIRNVSEDMALTCLVSALFVFCLERKINIDKVVALLKIGDTFYSKD